MTRWLAALAAFLACAGPAHAHTRSQSQSYWSVEGDALVVRVEADAVEATRLYALGGDAPIAETFARETQSAFMVRAGGEDCAVDGAAAGSLNTAGRVISRLRFACPEGALARGPITIESRLFLRVAPSHLHFLALRDADGAVAEAVLTEPHPRAVLRPSAEPESHSFASTAARFLPVGAEHVWTGLDHVAFILALVLLTAGRWRAVLLAATGFTLGHTATLGLAAADVLRPDAVAIEALIGFTIAFVALEAGDPDGARLRAWSAPAAAALALGGVLALAGAAAMSPLIWFGLAVFTYAYPRGFSRGAVWIALAFGLIHGCGFAAALGALDLPRPRLLASLLGFNLGVEFAQIVVIAGALVIAGAARRVPERVRAEAVPVAGAGLFALGGFWFASRLLA